MGSHRILFVACLVASLSQGSIAARAGITIGHQPVGCLVAEKFPLLESRLDPADEVASARVYFKGDAGSPWYYVEMKRDPAANFRGVLPKPKKDLARVHYYIETTAKDLTSARTAEFAPDVVANAASCKAGRTLAAAAAGSASVVVGAVGGAPAIPLGFSASGLAAGTAGGAATGAGAAGGGLGTPVIVVGAAAVVAGAAVAVVKKTGGDNGDCGTGPNSLTVLERSATTLRLQWSVDPPPASGCYTVDYLTGVASCSTFPPHGNILPLQGTSVNLTGLTPDTTYHIHVHPLSACNGSTSAGGTNVVFVRTLPAGSAPQPTTRSDYESCCPGG